MADAQASLARRVIEWLRGLAGARDGFLVLAGLSYVFGYITWSVNAKLNGLGPLPAINSQYFIAGIVPLLTIFLVYGGIRGGIRIGDWYNRWLGPAIGGWKRRLRQGIRFGFVGSMAGIFLFFLLGKWFPQLGPVMFIFMGLFMVNLLLMPDSMGLMALFLVVYLGVAAVVLYIFVAYPNLPQEFGGVCPRCGYLDVVKSDVSNATLERIAPRDPIGSDSRVVRSFKVDILYSGGDVMLVRPYLEGEADPRTYEIKKGVIQAVISCEPTNSTLPQFRASFRSVAPFNTRQS